MARSFDPPRLFILIVVVLQSTTGAVHVDDDQFELPAINLQLNRCCSATAPSLLQRLRTIVLSPQERADNPVWALYEKDVVSSQECRLPSEVPTGVDLAMLTAKSLGPNAAISKTRLSLMKPGASHSSWESVIAAAVQRSVHAKMAAAERRRSTLLDLQKRFSRTSSNVDCNSSPDDINQIVSASDEVAVPNELCKNVRDDGLGAATGFLLSALVQPGQLQQPPQVVVNLVTALLKSNSFAPIAVLAYQQPELIADSIAGIISTCEGNTTSLLPNITLAIFYIYRFAAEKHQNAQQQTEAMQPYVALLHRLVDEIQPGQPLTGHCTSCQGSHLYRVMSRASTEYVLQLPMESLFLWASINFDSVAEKLAQVFHPSNVQISLFVFLRGLVVCSDPFMNGMFESQFDSGSGSSTSPALEATLLNDRIQQTFHHYLQQNPHLKDDLFCIDLLPRLEQTLYDWIQSSSALLDRLVQSIGNAFPFVANELLFDLHRPTDDSVDMPSQPALRYLGTLLSVPSSGGWRSPDTRHSRSLLDKLIYYLEQSSWTSCDCPKPAAAALLFETIPSNFHIDNGRKRALLRLSLQFAPMLFPTIEARTGRLKRSWRYFYDHLGWVCREGDDAIRISLEMLLQGLDVHEALTVALFAVQNFPHIDRYVVDISPQVEDDVAPISVTDLAQLCLEGARGADAAVAHDLANLFPFLVAHFSSDYNRCKHTIVQLAQLPHDPFASTTKAAVASIQPLLEGRCYDMVRDLLPMLGVDRWRELFDWAQLLQRSRCDLSLWLAPAFANDADRFDFFLWLANTSASRTGLSTLFTRSLNRSEFPILLRHAICRADVAAESSTSLGDGFIRHVVNDLCTPNSRLPFVVDLTDFHRLLSFLFGRLKQSLIAWRPGSRSTSTDTIPLALALTLQLDTLLTWTMQHHRQPGFDLSSLTSFGRVVEQEDEDGFIDRLCDATLLVALAKRVVRFSPAPDPSCFPTVRPRRIWTLFTGRRKRRSIDNDHDPDREVLRDCRRLLDVLMASTTESVGGIIGRMLLTYTTTSPGERNTDMARSDGGAAADPFRLALRLVFRSERPPNVDPMIVPVASILAGGVASSKHGPII